MLPTRQTVALSDSQTRTFVNHKYGQRPDVDPCIIHLPRILCGLTTDKNFVVKPNGMLHECDTLDQARGYAHAVYHQGGKNGKGWTPELDMERAFHIVKLMRKLIVEKSQ